MPGEMATYRIPDWVRNTGPSRDGCVLLDTRASKLFAFNSVAARIFQLLASGKSESAIVSAIASGFGIDRATAQRDLAVFVAHLVELRLLELETYDGTCSRG